MPSTGMPTITLHTDSPWEEGANMDFLGVCLVPRAQRRPGVLCVESHANIPELYSVRSLVTVVRFRMGRL